MPRWSLAILELLANLAQLLGARLAQRNVDLRHQASGGVVVLVVEAPLASAAARIVEATRRASHHPVTAVDLLPALAAGAGPGLRDAHRPPSIAELLQHLDELCASQGIVVVAVTQDDERIEVLLKHADRVLALLRRRQAASFVATLRATGQKAELVLIDDDPLAVPVAWNKNIVRRADARRTSVRPTAHGSDAIYARTKVGVALGAGGAKAFAHAAVIEVVERAGYSIDYLSGSSMGAVVAVWRALGMSGSESLRLCARGVPRRRSSKRSSGKVRRAPGRRSSRGFSVRPQRIALSRICRFLPR